MKIASIAAVLVLLGGCATTPKDGTEKPAEPTGVPKVSFHAASTEPVAGWTTKSTQDLPLIYVNPRPELTDADVESAELGENKFGNTCIFIHFDKEAGQEFSELTRLNLGRHIAIMVDGELISAPRVMSVITGGTAVIDGPFDEAWAENVVASINS